MHSETHFDGSQKSRPHSMKLQQHKEYDKLFKIIDPNNIIDFRVSNKVINP